MSCLLGRIPSQCGAFWGAYHGCDGAVSFALSLLLLRLILFLRVSRHFFMDLKQMVEKIVNT